MKSLGRNRRSFRTFAVLVLALLLLPINLRVVSASVTATQFQSSTRDAQKITAILVEFPDVKHSVDRSTIQERLTELDAFFREVSYGLAWIKAEVTEKWYEVSTPLSKYDIQKWSFNQADMSDFRRNAIAVADSDINYQNYAYVIIIAAGKVWGNAAGSVPITNGDGVSRFNIVVLNEQSQMGTYAHELGHLAPSEYRPRGGIGLPDLYSYEAAAKNESASVFMGPWCIMDVSKTPRHFCAWSKIMLGWMTPEVVKLSTTQVLLSTIQPLEEDKGLRAVEVPLKRDSYYVIEVRKESGYDRNLPGEGVLIYRVDESKKSGYGVLRVMDRNSSTKTFDDAPFLVGDKFEDDENGVYIAVVTEKDLGFTVAISGSKILSLKDSDGDGLFDYVEERSGTDPRNPDTDGDGLLDGEEVNKYGTDPLRSDTDGDGLADGDEIKKYGTDPLQWDTDGDHWGDGLDVAPKNPLMPNILLVAVAAVVVLVVAVRKKRSSVRTEYAPGSFGEVTSAQMMGTVQTKYCSECGFALSLGAKFCSKCGAKQSYYGDE